MARPRQLPAPSRLFTESRSKQTHRVDSVRRPSLSAQTYSVGLNTRKQEANACFWSRSGYSTYMTSADMNRLAGLYSEIENRLERGETASPELAHLFDEVSKLVQSGEDVWFNLDPKG